MPRGRPKGSGTKESKKIQTKIEPVLRKHAGKITEPYRIMEDLIEAHACFAHLKVAKIKLWWVKDWKADVDGIATGAQVCKASELDRNLKEEASSGDSVDIFIKLPREQWPTLDDTEKRHRLFHELCHIRPAMNAEGKQKEDTKGRLLWRMRRHPITAFPEEIEEFGIERVVGHNGSVVDSIRLAERPTEKLFDKAEGTNGKVAANGDATAADRAKWRDWPIASLAHFGLPAGKVKILEKAFDDRMGKLMDSLAKMETPGFWWKDLKRLGESGYDAMVDAIATMRNERPEFDPDEAKAPAKVW